MQTAALESYYRRETVYQRLGQSSHTTRLLEAAAARINRGAEDYESATGKPYTYKEISYPYAASSNQHVTMEQAAAINDASTPITQRLKLVGSELLVGKEAFLASEQERGAEFLSLKNRTTARDKVRNLVNEAARTMDDLMVKLTEANHAKIPADPMEEYLGQLGIQDLFMTRIALAGTPPDAFYEAMHQASGKEVDGLRRRAARLEADVADRYGAPQTVHLTVGPQIQNGLGK